MLKRFLKKMYGVYEGVAGRAFILLYHRVARVEDDPHKLCVSPERFRDHIKFLHNEYEIIPLQKLVQEHTEKKLKNQVAITFDDGYADNFEYALPILEEFKVPATIFVVAGQAGRPEPFLWDVNTRVPDQGRALMWRELYAMAKSPLIEIGAHTMSHPHLAKESFEQQKYEIEESKRVLEKMLQRSVSGFAYPFGGSDDFDAVSVRAVKGAGFDYACANIQGNLISRSYRYALPRRIVRDWDVDVLREKMKHAFYV